LQSSFEIGFERHACEAAMAPDRMEYLGNAVPRLPLAQCTRAICECDYVLTGTEKLGPTDRSRLAKNSDEQ